MPAPWGTGGPTFTLIFGDTRAESSFCMRALRLGEEPVPPDSTTLSKRGLCWLGLQELTLRKAIMWAPRLFLPGGGRGAGLGVAIMWGHSHT